MKAQAYKLPAVAAIFLGCAVLAVAACGGGGGAALPGNAHTLQLKTPLASPTPTPQRQPPPEFVYVANYASQTVSAYIIDQQTGALASVPGSPFAASMHPWGLSADPSGRFVYATGNNASVSSGAVSAFTMNATTGALTSVAGSPFPSDLGSGYPAIDPLTKFVYVSDYNLSVVLAFTIDAASGALTFINSYSTGPGASAVVVDPTSRFVYVPNNSPSGLGSVSAFSYDATSGALMAVPSEPFAAGHGAYVAAIDPSGKFLYATNNGASDNSISAYTINATTGVLLPLPGSPFPAGSNPDGIAVDPSGKFVYAANVVSGNVSAYTINPASGALTSAGTFPTGNQPLGIAVDRTGKFVYVTNQSDNTISAFSINLASGALSLVGTFPTNDPHGVAVAP